MAHWTENAPTKRYKEPSGPITLDDIARRIDTLTREIVTLQKQTAELNKKLPVISKWQNSYWDTTETQGEPPRHFTWIEHMYKPRDDGKPGRGFDYKLWQAIEQADATLRVLNQAAAKYKLVLEDAELSSEWRDELESRNLKSDYPRTPG